MVKEYPMLSQGLQGFTDKGLVTNYGEGGYTMGGGHVKFYPYKKRGGKSFSHAKGGHKRFWGSFLMR